MPLTPVGLGTPFVENFTSLLGRTAEHEVRKVQTLLNLILPPAERDRIPAISIGEGMNAATVRTERLVEALTRASGNPDVIRTTFLWARDDLWLQNGFRRTRVWCPACLDESGADQLLFSLSHMTVCPRHEIELQVTCHRCGRSHRRWHRAATALACPCGGDLRVGPRTPGTPTPLQRASADLVFHIQAGLQLPPDRIAAGARHVFAARPGLRVALPGIYHLVTGLVRPQFITLATLLAETDCSPAELLSHGAVTAAPRPGNAARCPRHDLSPALKRLRLELSRPVEQRASPYEIAKALGTRPATLKAYFPALMEVLFSDWRHLRRMRKTAKEARNVSLVLERANARLAEGLPVSGRAITGDLGRRNRSLLRDERRALDDFLAKLG